MTQSLGPPRASEQGGFALMIVLLLTMIIMTLVGDLAYQAHLELTAAENISDQTMIEYSIDGQIEYALAHLTYDKKQDATTDSEKDGWNSKDLKQRTDDKVALTQSIVDECGKFNLIRLTTGSEAQQARARDILVRLLDKYREESSDDISQGTAMDYADRIIGYLKRETSAAGGIPRPRTATPGLPLLLEELVFVDPKNFPSLLIDKQTKEKVAPGLYRVVTVYGPGKVNLNTAPVEVLRAFFGDNRDRDIAQAIIDRRNRAPAENTTSGMNPAPAPSSGDGDSDTGNPFTDVNQLTDGSVDGLTLEVLQRNQIDPGVDFDVKSDFFSVRITGGTKLTERKELYVVERVSTDGFRFLLHQERTDPVLDTSGGSTSN